MTVFTASARPALSWTNILFFGVAHLAAVFAVVYLAVFRCSGWTIGLGALWFAFCGLAITAGYHRHFAHPTHKAAWPLRAFYLFFGAASVQHSALKWSADHREHHAETDDEGDPYDARKGFWWSHIGWIFVKDEHTPDLASVPDLARDPLVQFQHRHIVLLGLLAGCVLPAALGLLWRDPIGAVLCAGFLRLVVQWHATFSINSVAHMIGTQPYSTQCSARDSWITAMVTFGEGYHNYHHRFPGDYRNGIRWYHFDPTKWCLYLASKMRLAWDLRRIPGAAIQAARAAVAGGESAPGTESSEQARTAAAIESVAR